MLRTIFVTTVTTTALAASLTIAGSAQSRRDSTRDNRRSDALSCSDGDADRERARHCEIRDETIGGANPLDVDAGRNGGIRVRGWDRGDVVVRTRIEASADTDADARRLVSGVRVDTGGGRIRAEGPETRDHESWNVSFEVNVPRTAMLTLNTNNGGISIDDFRGTATFHAHNGGLSLTNVGGDLRGDTTNGGVNVSVAGDHWDGSGLDVETRNGGITLNVPKGFSAELEAGTTHGRLNIDFPVTVSGTFGSHLQTTLGSGGPKVRAITTNGGITIRQR
jgi:Putative adhesin